MSLTDNLTKQLTKDEDSKPTVYADQFGYATIGVGRLVDPRKPGAGLRPHEIAYLLQNDILDRVSSLNQALPWFKKLDEARQGVLLNMAFQLGVSGLLGFKNTLALVASGAYAEAADHMLDSTWAKQTPNRAKRLADQMRTGQWVFQGA